MDAMHLPNANHSLCCTKPVRHFRYSTGGLEEQKGRTYGDYMLNHAHTLSGRLSPVIPRTFDFPERIRQPSGIDLKLDKLSQRFSKIAASDTTIPENFKNTSRNSLKTNILRRSVSVEDEFNKYSENIYETVDSSRYSHYPRRVIRSDSDRLIVKEKAYRPPIFRSEQRIKSIYDSVNSNDQEEFIEMLNKKQLDVHDSTYLEKQIRMKFGSNAILEKSKDIRSDTDLALRKQEDAYHSSSCNTIYTPTESRNLSSSHECCQYSDYIRSDEYSFGHPSCIKPCKKAKRTNSILKHFIRSKPDVCSPLTKKQSVKRRSLSFLRKIWKKKEPKFDDDVSFNTEQDMQEIQRPNSELACSSVYSAVELSIEYEVPLPEPPPDYSHFTDVEDQAPELPPRTARGPTPWDEPKPDNDESDEPPALPVKKRKRRKANALDGIFQDSNDPGLGLLFKEPDDCNNQKELGEIMAQLADINAAPLKYTNSPRPKRKSDEDPDYDIPRPHDSLLLDIKKTTPPDKLQPTHFFSQFDDSLDVSHHIHIYDEPPMAPDSLECDPWSLSEGESNYERWTPQSQIRKTIISSTYGSNREMYFKDTIKLPHKENSYINMQNGFIQLHT